MLSDKLTLLLGQQILLESPRPTGRRDASSLPGAPRDALARGPPRLSASAPQRPGLVRSPPASPVTAGADPELLSGAGVPRKGPGLGSPGRRPVAVAGTPEPGRTPAGTRGRPEARDAVRWAGERTASGASGVRSRRLQLTPQLAAAQESAGSGPALTWHKSLCGGKRCLPEEWQKQS